MENLDSMTSDELWTFALAISGVRPIRKARELFPDKPERYVETTKRLSGYAANKAIAQQLRIAGKIDTAMIYETICDRIYRELPGYAKW